MKTVIIIITATSTAITAMIMITITTTMIQVIATYISMQNLFTSPKIKKD